MKSELILRKYKMNRNVDIIVKSTKMKNADVYINKVTLEFTTSDVNPLKLDTRGAIAHYIKDVDMDDDQQELFDEKEED